MMIFIKNIIPITIITVSIYQYAFAAGCDTNEITIATCDLKGKVSRQASIFLNESNNKLRYIFRKNNINDLQVNFNKNLILKRWVDEATWTTWFGFTRGNYAYVIGVPEEKPEAVAFMHILKNKELISETDCKENSFGEKEYRHNFIQDIPDNIVRDNAFRFP